MRGIGDFLFTIFVVKDDVGDVVCEASGKSISLVKSTTAFDEKNILVS